MRDPLDSLILDLLEWLGPGSRPYPEVIEAWRTSCPRLPVWEEANLRGYLAHPSAEAGVAQVAVSDAGRDHLRTSRPPTDLFGSARR